MSGDGGPAFPRPASEDTTSGTLADGNDIVPSQSGMTLRDYFAAQMLPALIHTDCGDGQSKSERAAARARRAYEHADAMLVERAKPQR